MRLSSRRSGKKALLRRSREERKKCKKRTQRKRNRWLDGIPHKTNKEDLLIYKEGILRKIFDKFDKYSCIKNDKWYKEFKAQELGSNFERKE